MQVTDYDMICRGSNELERAYRGDHIVVWEPGNWYVTEVTQGPLEEGVDYLFGFVTYDPNIIIQGNMYAYQWTAMDAGGGNVGLVDYCLPTGGYTTRQLTRSEYDYYFGQNALYNVLFNVDSGKLRHKGTAQYLSLGAQQSTPDLGRGIILDANGKPYVFGAETGQDLRLIDNAIEFAWMYLATSPSSPVEGGARRYPSPVCQDYSDFVKVYRLERHR